MTHTDGPAISPDGRYVAYVRAHDGGVGIRVRAAPTGDVDVRTAGTDGAAGDAGPPALVRVPAGATPGADRTPDDSEWSVGGEGALYPQWGPDGGEIFFVRGDTLFAQPVTTTDGFRTTGEPTALFAGRDVSSQLSGANTNNPTFAVTAAGDRFAIVGSRGEEGRSGVVVLPAPEWSLNAARR